jgi:hypothetical protein
MSVTEYERNQLFAWFEHHMGKERAATMMSLLPPVGWGDVATRRDLDHAIERLEARFETKFERVDARFDRVDARFGRVDDRFDRVDDRFEHVDSRFEQLDAKIDGVAERLDAKIDTVAERMATKSDLEVLRSDLQRTFITWILTAQATVIAAVVGLAALLG